MSGRESSCSNACGQAFRWGDRVDRFSDLKASPSTPPQPLYAGAGYDRVLALADELNITSSTSPSWP